MKRIVLGVLVACLVAVGLAAQQQALTVTFTIPAAMVDDVRDVVTFYRGPTAGAQQPVTDAQVVAFVADRCGQYLRQQVQQRVASNEAGVQADWAALSKTDREKIATCIRTPACLAALKGGRQ